MWHLSEPGTELVSLALQGRFLTTEPPGSLVFTFNGSTGHHIKATSPRNEPIESMCSDCFLSESTPNFFISPYLFFLSESYHFWEVLLLNPIYCSCVNRVTVTFTQSTLYTSCLYSTAGIPFQSRSLYLWNSAWEFFINTLIKTCLLNVYCGIDTLETWI